MENLWGSIDTNKIDTPRSILEQQGQFLSEATRRILYTEVERDIVRERVNDTSDLIYNFKIKGKHMENFSYKLLTIMHPIDLYPLTIELDSKTFDEIKSLIEEYSPTPLVNIVTVNSQGQYITVLKFILSSNRVKNLIKGIFSLSAKESSF